MNIEEREKKRNRKDAKDREEVAVTVGSGRGKKKERRTAKPALSRRDPCGKPAEGTQRAPRDKEGNNRRGMP